MKKWKVVLDRLGYVQADGHREFQDRHIIATCSVEGEAHLIAYALKPHYKTLTDIDKPDMPKHILKVIQ